MTDDQIRIALAEASQGIIEYTEGVWFYWSNGRLFSCKENDPLEDLNACAEFEKTMTDEEWRVYSAEIVSLTLWDRATDTMKRILQATARQRCLAYLRMKGILP